MRMKAFVAVALAVWMTWAAFLSLPTIAAPPHIVGGGLYGPTPPGTQAGNGNAANVATYTFYSTSQPAFSVLTGADGLTPADGTNQTFFLKDVGSNWNWNSGDIAVAVVETIRGTNGWASFNYTTSYDAPMSTANGTTDLLDSTLERIPPVTLSSGAGFVNVQWTALADTQGNVMSYEVYRAGTAYGAYSPIGVTNHAAGPLTYNDAGLAAGQYCYELAVNYHRDQATAVYTTTGRSEPGPATCATIAGSPPRIMRTDPANGATNVPVAQPIVVDFDQVIVPGNGPFSYTVNPDPGGRTDLWSNASHTVTISHAPFGTCAPVTVTIITAQNAAGANVGPGPVPNPWTFTPLCPNPQVVTTTPVDGATGVKRASSVVITFNKAMNTGSVVVTFTPAAGSPTCVWNGPTNTVCTLAVAMLESTWYYVNVTGTDVGGMPLVAGPVPYHPFHFKSNDLPIVNIQYPNISGICVSGGTVLTIQWTMSDAETVPANLLNTYINYTYPVLTPITPGAINRNSPATYPWTTPASGGDFDAQIVIDAVDAAGERGSALSPSVHIDTTAPTISSTTPIDNAASVATDAAVSVTFSEPMDTAATGTSSVISFNPAVTGLTYTWSNLDKTVTVGHPAFASGTQYQLIITATAKDACTPGKTLAADQLIHFTTGAGTRKPGAPTNVRAPSAGDTTVQITWDANTSWTDGSSLPENQITSYNVYRASSLSGTKQKVGTVTSKTFTDTGLAADTTYYYWVTEIAGGIESDYSAPSSKQTSPPSGSSVWLYILIAIIVVALLIVGLLLMRRRGAAAAPPKGAKPSRAPPAEEEGAMEERAPAEPSEETSSAEGGEKFIPCPNCGTMVKPTDAECFVCGAKL